MTHPQPADTWRATRTRPLDCRRGRHTLGRTLGDEVLFVRVQYGTLVVPRPSTDHGGPEPVTCSKLGFRTRFGAYGAQFDAVAAEGSDAGLRCGGVDVDVAAVVGVVSAGRAAAVVGVSVDVVAAAVVGVVLAGCVVDVVVGKVVVVAGSVSLVVVGSFASGAEVTAAKLDTGRSNTTATRISAADIAHFRAIPNALLVVMSLPDELLVGMGNAASEHPTLGRSFPRVQIITIRELLDGKTVNMPSAFAPYLKAKSRDPDQLTLGG